jgi:hypothetical protein
VQPKATRNTNRPRASKQNEKKKDMLQTKLVQHMKPVQTSPIVTAAYQHKNSTPDDAYNMAFEEMLQAEAHDVSEQEPEKEQQHVFQRKRQDIQLSGGFGTIKRLRTGEVVTAPKHHIISSAQAQPTKCMPINDVESDLGDVAKSFFRDTIQQDAFSAPAVYTNSTGNDFESYKYIEKNLPQRPQIVNITPEQTKAHIPQPQPSPQSLPSRRIPFKLVDPLQSSIVSLQQSTGSTFDEQFF